MEAKAAVIWIIEISAQERRMMDLLEILDENERARAFSYRRPEDMQRFVLGRAILKELLGRVLNMDAGKVEICYGLNGKPELKTPENIHFNVSHSGNLVLIAFSECEIGVDVEWSDEGFDFKDVLPDYFSKADIGYILEEDSCSRFFECWTKKEALAKASGLGIGQDNFKTGTPELPIKSMKLNDAYWLSVAGTNNITLYHY
ncbi:4'-phosphopantetheinyl transferase superfamily protein [Pedobacter sp. MC2016-14]|uniref:4'-phosphopantetheinyl transferase family protein n=1 Tax=Pedobacter sp. MC2016-14 TaxID=2897327 RepID=UPI001E52C8F6|nr:4'-phosphopantetheinyl transferase superfamily protein [Pedobacter sp. MC2016-14]MCD0489815.1 4'-phosphopantetheinyl transferase superfamily protein [Pedobacter sp. MC2016-14]